MSRPRLLPLLVLLPLLAMPAAQGADGESGPPAHRCAAIESRAERLACYDALFPPDAVAAGAKALAAPPLWQAAARQERRRAADDRGLAVDTTEGEGVLLTAPALGTAPPRPTLVLACHNAITHFELHLPEAGGRGRVELTLARGETRLRQTWQMRADGHVLSGGRGLPAIATLRQLLPGGTLTLRSDDAPALDGLRFQLGDLREALKPLRNQCQW
ncbi:type VI secretion system-associated protein VasI [Alkalilimnicola ehrlichii MLHE-1]|uniref:Type VI secretion-associated protein, VC_A0118 family n=1 Tax=Alkalilimnicola ehrlichii (strain ATCC BAA-1101 / DSM 17681 / MLHE-1) TaxID=187272 RepID=Q0ACM5_ALKEH|nr:type VI secretion system-associated protein VasI [Alkalilimnicola ehrlichii]ABI55412.1 conserved hypothetical protein [Alkalilimnicola ehrlichii MLHE-1]